MSYSPSTPIKKTTVNPVINLTDQLQQPILYDSFVAKQSTVNVLVSLSAETIGAGRSNIAFIVGAANQATPLTTASGGLVSGATLYSCGSIEMDQQNSVYRKIVLTGLTIGATYNWVITSGITGGSYTNIGRTDAGCTWTTTSTVITDPYIQPEDNGLPVTGTGIPANAYVGRVIPETSFLLSSSPTAQVNLTPSSGTGGSITIGSFSNPSGIALRTGVSGIHNIDKGWITNGTPSAGGPQVIPFLLGGRGYGWIGGSQKGVRSQRQTEATAQPYGSQFLPAIQGTSLGTAADIAVTPDGSKVFVGGFGTQTMHVINADTDKVISTFNPLWLTTTNVTYVSTTVTATFASTTGLSSGEAFFIGQPGGMTNIQGTWTISSLTSTTITFTVASTPTGTYSGAATLYQAVTCLGNLCDNTYGYFSDYYGSMAVRVNLATGALTKLILGNGVAALSPEVGSISPDGTRWAIPCGNGTVQIVNLSGFTLGTSYNLVGVQGNNNGYGTPAAITGSTTLVSTQWANNNDIWVTAQTSTVGTFVRINTTTGATTAYGGYGINPGILAMAALTNRNDTATVTSGSPVVADASITEVDKGRLATGTGIPAGSYVGTLTQGQSFRLSSSPSSQVDVNATANGTSVNISGANNFWCVYGKQVISQMWAAGPYIGQMFVNVTLSDPNQTLNRIAITNDGQIYWTAGSGTPSNYLFEWPGAQFNIGATSDLFTGDHFEVIVEGGS